MKKSIKFILLICVSLVYVACTNEDTVIRYPASTPKIDTAVVSETQIMYGDSIHLKLAVSDKVAPLSTMLVKVVVNNEVVISETIRTKGNSASIKRTYGVPFVANRPDNAPVKIYLTETNVSGTVRDSIVSTTIAKRPVIPELWIVPDGVGKGAKLSLTDAANLLYSSTSLTFGNNINYKIATKVKGGFNAIDWTGMVFGVVDAATGKIGLVDINGLSINSTDGTLIGISSFTFDALHFTTKVGGKLLEPVKTLDINLDLPAITLNAVAFRGGNVFFGDGLEVTFTGMTDLAKNISPDYFEVTGANTAIFHGKSGLYKAYYLISTGYLYIEPLPNTVYPDCMWICGLGFGRPQSPFVATSSWNWNGPLDYAPCALISAGVYQVTVYVNNEIVTDAASLLLGLGTLNFKFFHQRNWAATGLEQTEEEWSTKYTVQAPLMAIDVDSNHGNTIGNGTVFSGIYRITLNKNDMTIKIAKMP